MTSVIIVDDDKDVVDSLSMLLESNGIEVIGKGYDGLEAVVLPLAMPPVSPIRSGLLDKTLLIVRVPGRLTHVIQITVDDLRTVHHGDPSCRREVGTKRDWHAAILAFARDKRDADGGTDQG